MKQRYAVIVLFALIIASSFTSLDSYRLTSRIVNEDMDRALALALEEQQSDVISQDTIRTFNNHLQIAELRGKATLAVDTRGKKFKAYAHCSEATIFSLSDQRPATILWIVTMGWGMFCLYRRKKYEPANGDVLPVANPFADEIRNLCCPLAQEARCQRDALYADSQTKARHRTTF